MPALTEADTCRKYVLPKLYASGWTDDHINEQRTFTDGRIVVAGNRAIRRKQKRVDYLLRYRPDFAIAIVEAKADYKKPAEGPGHPRRTHHRFKPTRRRPFRPSLPSCLQRPGSHTPGTCRTSSKRTEGVLRAVLRKARAVLHDIVDKYVDYGTAQFAIPEILKIPPISERGTVMDISQMFGGAENLRSAINKLQALLYAA